MKTIKNLKNLKKGFTLIELIAVIVVIGILAAIALPRVGDMRTAATTAKNEASLAVVKGALERAITEGALTEATDPQPTDANWFKTTVSPVTGVPYIDSSANVGNIKITKGAQWPNYTIAVQ